MKRISIKSALCSLCAAVAVAVVSVIAVDSQTLPLGNESFHSYNFSSSGTPGNSIDITTSCDSTQKNGTVNYTLSGSAAGPFEGTYNESGSYTVQDGTVTQFQASFSIAPAGGGASITGTKSLGGPAGTFVGGCSSATTKAAQMTGLFNYTANVNGSNSSGTGGMVLDAVKAGSTPATGFSHTNFYTDSSSNGIGDAKTTGGGHILKEGASNGVHFGFNAQVQNNGSLHGRGTVHDHDSDTKIKILNVQTLFIAGTHATFTGECETNGVMETYIIDVDDIDEPARGLDTFKIVTPSYGPRAGVLTGGNIQVRGIGGGVPTPSPSPSPTPKPD